MPKLPSLKDIDALLDDGETEAARDLIRSLHATAMSLREDNLDLRERLAAAGPRVTFEGGLYWTTSPDGHRDGPFCQQCRDANEKLSRLQSSIAIGGLHQWWCSVCGSQYAKEA